MPEKRVDVHRRILFIIFTVLVLSAGLAVWRSTVLLPLQPAKKRARLSSLQTGDLLLWSTLYDMDCDVQKFALNSAYTHVSIVFVDARGQVFTWEARPYRGIVLAPLQPRIVESGTCHVRQLLRHGRSSSSSSSGTTPVVCPLKMESIIRACRGQGYSGEFWRAVLNYWCAYYIRVPFPSHPAINKLKAPRFCSQLAADTYARLGVVCYDHFEKPSSMALPAEFSELAEHLPLVNGYSFGPEMEVC